MCGRSEVRAAHAVELAVPVFTATNRLKGMGVCLPGHVFRSREQLESQLGADLAKRRKPALPGSKCNNSKHFQAFGSENCK
jgi:hypothetical protein